MEAGGFPPKANVPFKNIIRIWLNASEIAKLAILLKFPRREKDTYLLYFYILVDYVLNTNNSEINSVLISIIQSKWF